MYLETSFFHPYSHICLELMLTVDPSVGLNYGILNGKSIK